MSKSQEAPRRERVGATMAELERRLYLYESGPTGDGPSSTVMANSTGCSSVYASTVPFSPYGYDERQLCSPGFNLPVGRLTRSYNGTYPEYHTSADDLAFIRPESLAGSLEACRQFVEVLEHDGRYLNLSPHGEPRLGKRGLYGSVGGRSPAEREHAMLWVLNQSDGSRSLLDVARRSGLRFDIIREAAAALERAGLLERADAREKG